MRPELSHMASSLQGLSLPLLAGLTAAVVTFVCTPMMRSLALRFGLVDKPLEDRWGKRIVTRLGGAAMFCGFLVATLLWMPPQRELVVLLVGVSLVFGLGLLDDLHRMRPYTKLFGQLLIGCLVVMGGIQIELVRWTWLSIPLSVLWLVLIMNAFNLLDNMDGLSVGAGAIAAGFCALHAGLAQQWPTATLALILCGACLGFLRYNFAPAKVYMGDSGSHFLGLTLAALALLGTWRHSTQLLGILAIPVLVLAVPIFDTCFVTIQRLSHGQHPFEGGTDHVSHRLAILGLTVPQTVLALYLISALLGGVSLVSLVLQPLSVVVVWLVAVTLLVLFGSYLANVNVYRVETQSLKEERLDLPVRSVTFVETMLLHKRRLVEMLVDFALISSAYVCAYLLRFEGALSGDLQRLVVKSLPVILVIKLVCFAGCGLYRGVWRYLGLADILSIFKAVTLGSALSTIALVYLWRFEGYSRAVVIIDWMLLFLAIAGSRVVERLLDEWIARASTQATPTLIIGAGETGARVLQSLRYEGRGKQRIVGFLDDDPRKQGVRIQGCQVVGTRADLTDVVERYGVREVLVAISDPPGHLLQHIQRCCAPHGVAWKVVTAGVTDVR